MLTVAFSAVERT